MFASLAKIQNTQIEGSKLTCAYSLCPLVYPTLAFEPLPRHAPTSRYQALYLSDSADHFHGGVPLNPWARHMHSRMEEGSEADHKHIATFTSTAFLARGLPIDNYRPPNTFS